MSRERIGGDREEIINRGVGVLGLLCGGVRGLCVCAGGGVMSDNFLGEIGTTIKGCLLKIVIDEEFTVL